MSGNSNSPMAAPSYNFDWLANTGYSNLSPSIIPPACNGSPSGQLGHQDPIYRDPGLNQLGLNLSEPLSSELLESLQVPVSNSAEEGENGSSQSHMGGGVDGELISPSISARNNSEEGRISEEAGVAILDPLSAFCASVVRRQCETSAVASAAADYISWIRKVPPSGSPFRANSPYHELLENIEVRVRELAETARANHDESLRETLAALEQLAPPGGAVAARLASFEEDLQRQAQEHERFLQANYDVCRRLSEQRLEGQKEL
ncbi:hypothetical protein GGR52DRAFT_207890 [Hypoxylon sp. FL1284]|nr:hypothetical protein GGR52DRAFT_207890 [Hypoxylon sp. FL1284]